MCVFTKCCNPIDKKRDPQTVDVRFPRASHTGPALIAMGRISNLDYSNNKYIQYQWLLAYSRNSKSVSLFYHPILKHRPLEPQVWTLSSFLSGGQNIKIQNLIFRGLVDSLTCSNECTFIYTTALPEWISLLSVAQFVSSQKRDKTSVVTYRCPSNSAVQVYNYQNKTARVVFGPDLVILEPHETFNVLFLSGKWERVTYVAHV